MDCFYARVISHYQPMESDSPHDRFTISLCKSLNGLRREGVVAWQEDGMKKNKARNRFG